MDLDLNFTIPAKVSAHTEKNALYPKKRKKKRIGWNGNSIADLQIP